MKTSNSNSDNLLNDAQAIIEKSKSFTHSAVNAALVLRNWLLGKRIVEEELGSDGRADYGKQVIKTLSKRLTEEYGRGFEPRDLYRFAQFYKTYPEILTAALSKSGSVLSWSHYLALLRVTRKAARDWYEKEAIEQNWSVRTLDRNVSTRYLRVLFLQFKRLLIIKGLHQNLDTRDKKRCPAVQ